MPSFIITDIGSTTTKALFLAKRNGFYRLIARAEAPTTVEAPFEDVTIGVKNALEVLGKEAQKQFLSEKDGELISQEFEYYSSSSAGGGLQVLVIGLFSKITAISAQKAALGAGAILIDVISNDDNRSLYERVDIVRKARPDMILLTGGFNDGDVNFVTEFADIINAANPLPRFGTKLRLPVIYAGNIEARELIEDTLRDEFDLHITDNLRPSIDKENLEPARKAIHDLFLSHVMQQAPGYSTISDAVSAPIMPTPLAFGHIISELSKEEQLDILAVDIGGATTDIFSSINEEFNRTVSANLGMSYSIANVMQNSGLDNIKKWLPFEIEDIVLENIIGDKMLSPTVLPKNEMELMIEQAVAREALRLSLIHHKSLIRELPKDSELSTRGFISDELSEKEWDNTDTLVDMMKMGLLIASGGVLSHAPKRNQTTIMMIDAFRPLGVTRMAVDSVFMMPHLGVLAQKYPKTALQVLIDDCFVPLGTVISGEGSVKIGQKAARVEGQINNRKIEFDLYRGNIRVMPVSRNQIGNIKIIPEEGMNFGKGNGKIVETPITGGETGLIFDLRFGCDQRVSPDIVKEWLVSTGCFSSEEIENARRQARERSRDHSN
jgi:uncharacterized protein (TIGR01319 family)